MSGRNNSWPLASGDVAGRQDIELTGFDRNNHAEKPSFENLSSPILGMKRTSDQADIELQHPRPKRHHSVGFLDEDQSDFDRNFTFGISKPSLTTSPRLQHVQNQELASQVAKKSVMDISHILNHPEPTEASASTSPFVKSAEDEQKISSAVPYYTTDNSEHDMKPESPELSIGTPTTAEPLKDEHNISSTAIHTTIDGSEPYIKAEPIESPLGISQTVDSASVEPQIPTPTRVNAGSPVVYIKTEPTSSPLGIADGADTAEGRTQTPNTTTSCIDLTEENDYDAVHEPYQSQPLEQTTAASYYDDVYSYNNDIGASSTVHGGPISPNYSRSGLTDDEHDGAQAAPKSPYYAPDSPNYAPSELIEDEQENIDVTHLLEHASTDDLPDYEYYEEQLALPADIPDTQMAGDDQDPNASSDITEIDDSALMNDQTAETSLTTYVSNLPVNDDTPPSAIRKSVSIGEDYDDTLSEDSEYDRYVEESVASLLAAGVSPNSRAFSEREREVAKRLRDAQSEDTKKRLSTNAIVEGIKKMIQRAKDIHGGELPFEVFDVLAKEAAGSAEAALQTIAEENARLYVSSSMQTDPIPEPKSPKPSHDELYKRELELIRRPDGPLIDVDECDVIQLRPKSRTVKPPFIQDPPAITYPPVEDDPESSKFEPLFVPLDRDTRSSYHTGGGSSAFAYGADATIIDSSSDDEDGTQYASSANGQMQVAASTQSHPTHDSTSFYGYNPYHPRDPNTMAIVDKSLRYQDRALVDGRQEQYPEPFTGTRLFLDNYLSDINSTHRRDPDIDVKMTLQKTFWGVRNLHDDEHYYQHAWAKHGYKHYKGFPLVEDAVFVVPNNRAKPDGDCYWRSISFHLYGTDEHWALVKAEHLAYLYYVLTHDEHPRAQLYRESLNAKFFDTASTAPYGQFKANLWQILHLPHAWTPALISQVTADLYNICIITFTVADRGMGHVQVSETNVRGCYNSRHIFLAFVDGNHFQPMIPNDYLPWEFRYPRVSVEATARFANAPKKSSAKSTTQHPWRNDFTKEVMPPVPRLFGCDFESLRGCLGSGPQY